MMFDRKRGGTSRVGVESGRIRPEEVLMRPPEVFVRELAPHEGQRLKRLSKRSKVASTRQRASILLASATLMSAPQIARMWMTDESHVRKVIHDSNPCSLKSWITLRTCDSSVIHMRAICGALINVAEASRIDARCLVEATFDRFDKRFNRCPSCGASSRTNTSGGRIGTSLGRIRPNSTPKPEVPPRFRSNVMRGRTR